MQLRIWHKMIIGISIPSFIAILGGLLTYGYINDVKNRQGFVQIADELNEQIFEVRQNEKNFLHYQNSESHKSLHNVIGAFNRSISSTSSKISQETGQKDFSRLRNLIIQYLNIVDDLYESYMNQIQITEQVMTQGRNLEAFIGQGQDLEGITATFVLHLRNLETTFMLFRDKKSFLALEKSLSILQEKSSICPGCSSYIESVNRLAGSYETNTLMENRLRDTGGELEGITGQIAGREKEKISSFLSMSKRLLIAAMVLLCTLGPLFVYKTANHIVAPIKRIDDITKRISEGDTTLRAPIKANDETSSLASSFNIMLDHMMLTHQSLEKSMELLTEKQAQLVDSEKRASLGLLVSGVAHELNNPLNNISLIAERMSEEMEDRSADEVRDLNNILMQCERAKNIVDNLLDFARARKSASMERLDIVRVVNESFNLVSNQLRINNIKLENDIPDSHIFINGNRSKLEQILVSIFTNAVQAMKDHGILRVGLRAEKESGNVLLDISDNGPGIPKEDIRHIFEPFFTTKPSGKGTGLGLSVCKSLVMEHNGEINVESQEGEGTVFSIKFPLYQEAARSPKQEIPPGMVEL